MLFDFLEFAWKHRKVTNTSKHFAYMGDLSVFVYLV